MSLKKTDRFWMNKAYELAKKAKEDSEVPVGAVLVSTEDILLGQGYNRVISLVDPCAHAEILAIREAALSLKNYRLKDTTLYVTLEPCPMCAGAMVQARIKRVVFACRDFKAGAAGSVCNLLQGFNHSVSIDEGLMMEESLSLLQEFFQVRRTKI